MNSSAPASVGWLDPYLGQLQTVAARNSWAKWCDYNFSCQMASRWLYLSHQRPKKLVRCDLCTYQSTCRAPRPARPGIPGVPNVPILVFGNFGAEMCETSSFSFHRVTSPSSATPPAMLWDHLGGWRLQQKMEWKGQNFSYFLKNQVPYFWEKRIFLHLCPFSVLQLYCEKHNSVSSVTSINVPNVMF